MIANVSPIVVNAYSLVAVGVFRIRMVQHSQTTVDSSTITIDAFATTVGASETTVGASATTVDASATTVGAYATTVGASVMTFVAFSIKVATVEIIKFVFRNGRLEDITSTADCQS